jgi:hypothetical protein
VCTHWGMSSPFATISLLELVRPGIRFSGEWPLDLKLYPLYLRSRLRRGRGLRTGGFYLPWLKARDVPSRGDSHVLKGIRSGRLHQMVSNYEAVYFLLMERRRSVIDIREQWPILDIATTLRMCARLGINHPHRRAYPEPETVDFLVDEIEEERVHRLRAVAIKTPEDAKNPQKLLRLPVQQTWCDERGIPWYLADMSAIAEADIKLVLETLVYLRLWFRRGTPEPSMTAAERYAHVFLNGYEENTPLEELIDRTAKALRLEEAAAIRLFRYCAWSDLIPVDVLRRVRLDLPLVLVK